MKHLVTIAALCCIFHLCGAQQTRVISAAELEDFMARKTDTIDVINFWATWCGPCIKELPLFEKITTEGPHYVKVTLVSLDLELDPNPEKVHKFVARKNIRSQVLLLDAADPNSWINRIEPQWSGALPATIIINHRTGERKFIGRSVHEGELEQLLLDIQ